MRLVANKIFTGARKKTIENILLQLFLTFFGVLAALAVENYRESIEDKKKEKEYLFAIRQALQSDTATINRELFRCFKKMTASKKLLRVANTNQITSSENISDLASDILMFINPVYNTAVYEDLKSSGNLRLIGNNSLRNSIVRYYIEIENLMQVQREVSTKTSYNYSFSDLLDYDEFTFSKEIQPVNIIRKIRQAPESNLYLQRLQKDMTTMRNSLLFFALPNTLELLDKVNSEIAKDE